MNQNFLELSQSWVACVNRNVVNEVVELYDSQATFHPTLSGEFIQDTKSVRQYFTQFLAMKPKVTVVSSDLKELLETAFVFTGVMDIELDAGDDRFTIQARFTFVWALNGDRWSIVHHHNSIVPK